MRSDFALIDLVSQRDAVRKLLRGIDTAKRIANQKPLAGWGNKPLVAAARTDERAAIEKWVHGATMTTFHYCGTCRMGDDESSPVDARLKPVKNILALNSALLRRALDGHTAAHLSSLGIRIRL